MSLDRPGADRLKQLEDDVRELREFAAGIRGAVRLLMAIQGLVLAGIAYTVLRGPM